MKPNSNIHETFCKRLKHARLAKGFSQKSLGIAAGIDEFVASTRINRYEKGIHEADLDTIQRLAAALEVHWLIFLLTMKNWRKILNIRIK